MTNAINTKGRPAAFATNKKVAAALADLDNVSRYLALQLVEKGLVEVQEVKNGTKGRPAHNYVLTGKGRGLVALSKKWK